MKRATTLVVVLLLFSSLAAARKRDPLTDAEADQLRDARLEPQKRLKLFIRFTDERLDTLDQLRSDPKQIQGRGAKIHDLLEDFTSLMDEISSNLDAYGTETLDKDQSKQFHKGTKDLIDATARWTDRLRLRETLSKWIPKPKPNPGITTSHCAMPKMRSSRILKAPASIQRRRTKRSRRNKNLWPRSFQDMNPKLSALFQDAYRDLRPRAALPECELCFYPFSNLNNTIRLRQGQIFIRLSDLLEGAPESVLRRDSLAHPDCEALPEGDRSGPCRPLPAIYWKPCRGSEDASHPANTRSQTS